jgi:peptidoglycan/xylan/chitin deacetylase (PgdA/CDA1 family)
MLGRRRFLDLALTTGAGWALGRGSGSAAQNEAPRIAFTFDDFNVVDVPRLSGAARNRAMLDALQAHGLKAAVFVIGRNVEHAGTMRLLESWNEAGHIVGNHTYSHRRYSRVPASEFTEDVLRCDAILRHFSGFRKLLRFPFLDEGATAEQRDRMRTFLAERGYRNAHVTIDASDWYVDGRLRARLDKQRDADASPYRAFYLDHIWERARFYDGLSRQVVGRSVRHTLLLHHNVLNGMFLADLIQMFRSKGWQVINAVDAYEDPVFAATPDVLPAGQSLVWSLARQTGRFDDVLRYPGEDGVYEAPKMDALGL